MLTISFDTHLDCHHSGSTQIRIAMDWAVTANRINCVGEFAFPRLAWNRKFALAVVGSLKLIAKIAIGMQSGVLVQVHGPIPTINPIR